MTRGRFIAFEGGEASGKSTQAQRLAGRLGAVLTREPGGTPLGQRIRQLVLAAPDEVGIGIRAEALLLAADRAEHVATVIRPSLAAGRDVVTDRYAGSSIAYQGYGRGLDVDDLRRLSDWAGEGLWPDLVILLEVSSEVARARLVATGLGPDRLEGAGDEFHQRVTDGFRSVAAAFPDSWRLVDGLGPPGQVEARVNVAVDGFFGDRG